MAAMGATFPRLALLAQPLVVRSEPRVALEVADGKWSVVAVASGPHPMLPVGDGETVIPGRRPGGVWSVVSEQDAAHLLDVARTWWPLEHLADHLAEVPESPYRGKRR